MSYYIRQLLLCAISLFVLVACYDDSSNGIDLPSGGRVDTLRTSTLVYIMAENNLNSYSKKDIAEMYRGATDVPCDCGMFAFVDDVSVPRILRFYNEGGAPVCDTVYTFSDDFCSSDIDEFGGVFDWLLHNYPTKELNLVLWSHGSGWLKDAGRERAQRVIGFDNGVNSSGNSYPSVKAVEVHELAGFLEALPVKKGFIMFDACFMQGIEVIYELRNCADWIIASPAEIPGNGAPYDKLMPLFFAKALSPSAIIRAYYDNYPYHTGVLLSVVDCSNIEAFADATAPYIPKYFSKVSPVSYSEIFQYLKGGYFGDLASYPCYFDMNGAMMLHLTDKEYREWKKAFDRMVPYSCAAEGWPTVYNRTGRFATDIEQFGGVSMYLPRSRGEYESFNEDFATMEWYSRVGWENAGW